MEFPKALSLALLLLANVANAQTDTKSAIDLSSFIDTRITNEPEEVSYATQDEDFGEAVVLNNEELLTRLEVNDSITPETTELLGESIDLSTGALSFSNTDVSIPGNSKLPVSISRSFKGQQRMLTSELAMGNWDLDIPHISSATMKTPTVPGYAGPLGEGLNCSKANDDSWKGFMPNSYWNGDILSVPGKTSDKLLFSNNTLANTTGFVRVTKSGWRIKCHNESWGGQSFEVHSPDGTIYTMDTLRLIYLGEVKRQNRYKTMMLASKVIERFG